MGSIISAPIGMAMSCCGSLCGSCLASMACKACTCSCVVPQKLASAFYIGLLGLFVLFAVVARYDGGDVVIGGGYNASAASLESKAMQTAISGSGVLNMWNDRFWCASKHPHGWVVCCADVCGGVYSVYRFSFALCLFFAFLTLCTSVKSRFAARMHRGFWFIKVFVIVALLVSTLFIKNETMEGYREASRYLSFVFIIFMMLLYIDFGYTMNEKLLELHEKSESESCCSWKLAIILISLGIFIASIVGWVELYLQFGHSGCPVQQTFISLTLILSTILSVISCTKIAPHGTLLTSAFVTGYATYLCYSALASHPDAQCNPHSHRDSSLALDMLFGFFMMVIFMLTAWSATGSREALTRGTIGKEQGSELTTTLEDGTAKESSSDDADDELVPDSFWYYHLMMTACAIYIAMLLTDWSDQPAKFNGVPAVRQEVGLERGYATSLGTFWVKIVSQWICLVLYGWTLLAPYLCRNYRDFGVEFDFD